MDSNLFNALFAAAAPDAVLLETAAGQTLTYREALARSSQFANALRKLGVEPGDRVAVQVDKSVDALFLYLGSLCCGAVYLPLNTGYTLAEIDYFIGDAEPKVFVVQPHAAEDLTSVATRHGATLQTLGSNGGGTLADLAASTPAELAVVPRTADDLAAILYTSGTTGRSKGAMITHGNLLSNAETLRGIWRFTPADRLIHALPIFHVHGLFVAINTVMVSGASMIFLPKFDPAEVIPLMARSSVLMGVPTFYTRLLQQAALTRDATAKMRLFISGSAPLLPETHAEFRKRTGQAILERYGMTETGMNTSNPYDGDRIASTVGFPLPGVSIRIVDPKSGHEVKAGSIGMIEVKGPNVFKGYWRMPEKTAAEFRDDGYFITGDLGKIDQRGYVQIVGRGKDLVISGGYNIYPKEVETEIDQISGVEESAVIGVPHPDFGEGVTAVIVLKKGAMLSAQEVLIALDRKLARFKQPKAVIFVDELPRNTMGKVQKNVLRDTYRGLFGA